MCLIYGSHINVEICNTLATIKYLNKYITKGYDKADVSLRGEISEIDRYRNARYVSAMEAMWRIFEFPLWRISHSIIGLDVHLHGRDVSYIHVTGFGRERVKVAPRSKLEAFFLLLETDVEARLLKYAEVPEQYMWNEKTRTWKPRTQKKRFQIGRIYPVPLKDTERYALRVLLLNVPGPLSFEDIRTIDGVFFESYIEAALARGLMSRDNPYLLVFKDASELCSPEAFRDLFVNLLINKFISNGLELMEQYADVLSGDFLCRSEVSNVRHFLLTKIKGLFLERSLNVRNYIDSPEFDSVQVSIFAQRSSPVDSEATQLNEAQQMGFRAVVAAVYSKRP